MHACPTRVARQICRATRECHTNAHSRAQNSILHTSDALASYGTDLMQHRTREWQRSRVRVQTLASATNNIHEYSKYVQGKTIPIYAALTL